MCDKPFPRVESALMCRVHQKEDGGRVQCICHIARPMRVERSREMRVKCFATASECGDALQVRFVRQLLSNAKISFHKEKGRVWVGFLFCEPFGTVSRK